MDEFKVHNFLSDQMKLYDGLAFIIWKWSIPEHCPIGNFSGDHLSTTHISIEDECEYEETDEDESDTVAFKVIGNLKEAQYQTALKIVSDLLHKNVDVPVKLVPEPNNPYDKAAVAFVCTIEGTQHQIGYVVRECLDSVHDALNNNLVKSTKFSWCKYRTFNGHLGFYAAINITKLGKWPDVVHKSRSAF